MESKDGLITRYVKIGEIIFRDGKYAFKPLRSTLGSCVGLSLYDPITRLSAYAHMMLPEKTKKEKKGKLTGKGKYVDKAILYILDWFSKNKVPFHRLEAKIAGGASLFSEVRSSQSDSLLGGSKNVQKVVNMLLKAGINIVGQDTGGDVGRVMYFFPNDGKVLVREPLTGKSHII